MNNVTLGFLYSEVMGYTEACFKALLNAHIKLVVVHWDQNRKTPYQLALAHPNLKYVASSSVSIEQCIALLETENVVGLYVSGWMDRKYLAVARYFKAKAVKTVAGCDTLWRGTWKQKVAALFGKRWLTRYFDELLVAGALQYEFARRIGFNAHEISWPEYSCDVDFFNRIYEQTRLARFKKEFLFVGRLHESKGIISLVKAFLEAKSVLGDDEWTLKIIGNGPLQHQLVEYTTRYPAVSWQDFLQPEHLAVELQQPKVFCLPSISEPWGVVVHEFAVAGFPLLVSQHCGSAFHFLKDGYNGFLISPHVESQIVQTIKKVMAMTESELQMFGDRSHHLGMTINCELWAANLKARFL